MKKVYLTEKPSAGSDLAKVLGVESKGDGFYRLKDGGAVTWGFGHLLKNCEPEQYDPAWKSWSFDVLPFIPNPFRSEPKEGATKQLRVIASLIRDADEVVLATDWDREGELIGVEILEHLKWNGKTSRLCLTALDPASIRKSLDKLRDARETAPLARAAHARSMADWVVGLNMTRALSLCFSTGKGDVVTVGRVQTPTVALVVRRDLAIKNFKSSAYFELAAEVTSGAHKLSLRHAPGEDSRYVEKSAAQAVADAAKGGEFPLSVVHSAKKKGPKKLFDLGGLQKACNTAFGWSADKTLDVAQSLYEKHKVTSYPRTDCTFLPEEQEADVPRVLAVLASVAGLDGFYRLGFDEKPVIRTSVFNTSKVTAHHAIVPLAVEVDSSVLSADEKKAYLMVAKRYLSALAPDMEYDETRISIEVPVPGRDTAEFTTTGRVVRVPGWTGIEGEDDDEEDKKDAPPKLPPVENGESSTVLSVDIAAKKTQPPKSYTEATLLADMESVAKFCDDPKLKAVLKDSSGIGTPATRASILKTIRDRDYVRAEGKKLISTDKARRIFKILSEQFPALIDPAETARWEDALNAIAEGESPDLFGKGIAEFTKGSVDKLRGQSPKGSGASAGGSSARREGSATGVTDSRTRAEILDYGDFWQSAKGVRCYKEVAKRKMTLEEFVQVLEGKSPVFSGFKSVVGKDFSASLAVKKEGEYDKVVFVFDSGGDDRPARTPAKATGVTDPKTGKEFMDCGLFWRSEGGAKCWKEMSKRSMSLPEFVKVMKAKDPVAFSGFQSKAGKPFDANLAVSREGGELTVGFVFNKA